MIKSLQAQHNTKGNTRRERYEKIVMKSRGTTGGKEKRIKKKMKIRGKQDEVSIEKERKKKYGRIFATGR